MSRWVEVEGISCGWCSRQRGEVAGAFAIRCPALWVPERRWFPLDCCFGIFCVFPTWRRSGVVPLVVFVCSREVVLVGRVMLPDGLYELGFVEPGYAALERPDPGT